KLDRGTLVSNQSVCGARSLRSQEENDEPVIMPDKIVLDCAIPGTLDLCSPSISRDLNRDTFFAISEISSGEVVFLKIQIHQFPTKQCVEKTEHYALQRPIGIGKVQPVSVVEHIL